MLINSCFKDIPKSLDSLRADQRSSSYQNRPTPCSLRSIIQSDLGRTESFTVSRDRPWMKTTLHPHRWNSRAWLLTQGRPGHHTENDHFSTTEAAHSWIIPWAICWFGEISSQPNKTLGHMQVKWQTILRNWTTDASNMAILKKAMLPSSTWPLKDTAILKWQPHLSMPILYMNVCIWALLKAL